MRWTNAEIDVLMMAFYELKTKRSLRSGAEIIYYKSGSLGTYPSLSRFSRAAIYNKLRRLVGDLVTA